jgi:hypothetical protein
MKMVKENFKKMLPVPVRSSGDQNGIILKKGLQH